MAKKLSSTRNTAFNGYEFQKDGITYYASIASTSPEEIKKTTKTNYSNIKLLDYDEYTKIKGTDIVDYTKKIKESLGEFTTYISKKIIENEKLNTENKDFYIFGAPYKMVLDNKQQYGNCGVEAVLNVLAEAGIVTIKDQNKTEKSFFKKMWNLGIADDFDKLDVIDEKDGATTIYEQQEMLALYGIKSEVYPSFNINMATLGQYIKNGKGIILSVCSEKLWYGFQFSGNGLDHAISVIGVVYEKENPLSSDIPLGFIIQDTGGMMTSFITTDDLEYVGLKSENRGFEILITDESIKDMANNLTAEGDKYANIIYGNSGNNVIKGLAGNDTLYGGYGDDTIYGGNGNDTIYGNEGRDIIYGGKGNDVIYGVSGENVIYGDDGDDTIYASNWGDKIYGGEGNDKIYGGDGVDKIIAGNGNDTIYASDDDDRIDVGAGKDTIIIDSSESGLDSIYNPKGSVTFEYKFDMNDLKTVPGVVYDYDSNKYHLYFTDKNAKNGFILKNFFNYKKDKAQTVYLVNGNGKKYRISATKSKNATVADIKTDKAHKNINNILYTTNKTGTTITTSKKNDMVFMCDSPGEEYKEKEFNRKDKITYTGGKDTYYSYIGNTTYVVNFNKNTDLSIVDYALELKKIKYDEWGEPYYETLSPSQNDEIKFSSSLDNLTFFFDMDKFGNVTQNTSLFALYKTDTNFDTVKNNMVNISSSDYEKDISGYTLMFDFFKQDEKFGTENSFGNGQIEKIYTKENGKNVLYNNLDININSIKTAVLNWFNDNEGYNTVFEALSSNELSENINTLVECYTQSLKA